MDIKIDYEKCTVCRKCVYACNYGVLDVLDDMVVIASPRKCTSCMKCVEVCPMDAVSIE